MNGKRFLILKPGISIFKMKEQKSTSAEVSLTAENLIHPSPVSSNDINGAKYTSYHASQSRDSLEAAVRDYLEEKHLLSNPKNVTLKYVGGPGVKATVNGATTDFWRRLLIPAFHRIAEEYQCCVIIYDYGEFPDGCRHNNVTFFFNKPYSESEIKYMGPNSPDLEPL